MLGLYFIPDHVHDYTTSSLCRHGGERLPGTSSGPTWYMVLPGTQPCILITALGQVRKQLITVNRPDTIRRLM